MPESVTHRNPLLLCRFATSILAVVTDIEIAGQISFTVDFRKFGECFVRNIKRNELVVSGGEDIVVNVFEDRIGDLPIRVS